MHLRKHFYIRHWLKILILRSTKFCVVDLAAFEKVINRIGGIEMTLEQREAEYLNTTNYISKKNIEM